jgi:hypothetical protein
MKCGVLTFSYANFPKFKRSLEKVGHYTVNLGDNAQTIAARALFRGLGIDDRDIVDVDRDTIASYRGERVAVLMNAVFGKDCFPLSEDIAPIFVGYAGPPDVVAGNADYLRRHQPIGCRDRHTAEQLTKLGVEAYVSGCVTLTFPRRAEAPPGPKLFVVYGSGAGRLPDGVLRHAPPELLQTAELLFHRLPVHEIPLSAGLRRFAEAYELSIMERLSAQASLVATPLHHVAAPCMARGIPVVIARVNSDRRFSYLQDLTPVYTQETLEHIDWAPASPDVGPIAEAYVARVRAALAAL